MVLGDGAAAQRRDRSWRRSWRRRRSTAEAALDESLACATSTGS